MFRYISTAAQLVAERQKTAALQAALDKADANLAYVAMMADVDILEEDDNDEIPDSAEVL